MNSSKSQHIAAYIFHYLRTGAQFGFLCLVLLQTFQLLFRFFYSRFLVDCYLEHVILSEHSKQFRKNNNSAHPYTKFSGTTILMSTNACTFANLWLANLNRNCVMYPSAIAAKCVWHLHLASIVKTLRCRVLLLAWGKRICLNIIL